MGALFRLAVILVHFWHFSSLTNPNLQKTFMEKARCPLPPRSPLCVTSFGHLAPWPGEGSAEGEAAPPSTCSPARVSPGAWDTPRCSRAFTGPVRAWLPSPAVLSACDSLQDGGESPFPDAPDTSELIAREDVDILPYVSWQQEQQLDALAPPPVSECLSRRTWTLRVRVSVTARGPLSDGM